MNGSADDRLRSLAPALPAGAGEQFERLLDELERWNRKINLTAVRDRGEMQTTHLYDSLAALPFIKGPRVLDVGTGAGFPGLPLAIARPDCEFTLLDSNNKKIQFVQHAAGLLGLANVEAVWERAEDYAPAKGFDSVTARALATVPRLLALAGQHVGEDGVFVALKGRDYAGELDDITEEWDYSVTPLDVPGLPAGSRHVVTLHRRH